MTAIAALRTPETMIATAFRRHLRASLLAFCVGACVCGSALNSVAFAQSAADTATARAQAKQGIALYREGKFAEALDKLLRAQALYNAPVHVLYIARCQRDLGKLVEASESYRELGRTSLASDAPAPFFAAVRDGKKELQEVTPRIPHLLLTVSPSDAPQLSATVDGVEVPSAAIGIKRPLNPGPRQVTVTAEGYEAFETEVTVAEGAVRELQVELKAKTPVVAAPEAKPADEAPKEPVASDASDEPTSPISYVLGLRIGFGASGGKIDSSVFASDAAGETDFSNIAGGAADFQLRGGVSYKRMYGILLHLGAQSFSAEVPDRLEDDTGIQLTAPNRLVTADFGITGLIGTERGKFGFFGEIGLNLVHTMTHSYEYELDGVLASACTADLEADGTGIRFAGGLQIPLSKHFQLSPYAALSANVLSETTISYSDGCIVFGREVDVVTKIEDGPVHTVFSLGVGADYSFGD